MTETQQQYFMLKGLVASLPEDKQVEVAQAYNDLKATLNQYDKNAAVMVLGLVSLEYAE